MSSQWLQNHMGATLSDEEMEKIPNPKFEVGVHVVIKFMQAGGILGTWLFGPIAAVRKSETRNLQCLRMKMGKCGRAGVFIGIPLGMAASYAQTSKCDEYRNWDRCYRLRHNRGQVRADQASAVGSIGGAAIGYATGAGAWFGGLMGMSALMLAAAIYTSKMDTKQKKEGQKAKERSDAKAKKEVDASGKVE